MKTAKGALFAGLVGLTGALGFSLRSGAVLITEDFAYSAGELTGANGGSGFSAAWSGVNTGNTEVLSSGLTYTDPVTSLSLSASGLAFEVGNTAGNNFSRAVRSFSTVNQASLFVSLLVRRTTGTFSATDQVYMYFGTGSGVGNSERLGVFAEGNANGDLGLQASNGSTLTSKWDGGTFASATTYLLVAKLEKVTQTGATDPYDRVSFWVNPSLYASTFATPDQVVDYTGSNAGIPSLNQLGFGTASLETGDRVAFDRLRIGDDVSDILPLMSETVVPESSTVLVGTMLFGIGVRHLWRRRSAN